MNQFSHFSYQYKTMSTERFAQLLFYYVFILVFLIQIISGGIAQEVIERKRWCDTHSRAMIRELADVQIIWRVLDECEDFELIKGVLENELTTTQYLRDELTRNELMLLADFSTGESLLDMSYVPTSGYLNGASHAKKIEFSKKK